MKYYNSAVKALLALLIVAFLFHFKSNAQVTIGSGDPAEAALLQIKDKQAAAGTKDATASGGLLLPRVQLSSTGDFTLLTSPSEDQKKNHTGLLVYNLKEDANLHLEKGIYQWNGEEWKMLSKVTKTEGATVRKVIYRATSPDETQIVTLGIFEFRIDAKTYPQFRRIRGTGTASHYWQVNEFMDNSPNAENSDFNSSGYTFELKKKIDLSDNTWTDCKDGMGNTSGNTERNEVWLADLGNDNMYHIQFMILGKGGSADTKTYLIIAQKY
ncbi:MAG: hypothetical protein LBQ68_07585 [Clostridiales bacterium]|jgi:hypothetical protein|nr:hypothetical protein [Clostridiales bacterium]